VRHDTTRVPELIRRLAGARQLGQLVRAEPVLALVRELGGGTLLDVGAGALGLADYLDARWDVTAIDVSFGDYGAWRHPPRTRARRTVGDVRALPFEDRRFDAVVAVDVVEHLAATDRAPALGELARVARRRVVVAAPAGRTALEADRRLAAALPWVPPWLVEHLANGFPEPEELAAPLRAHGDVRTFGNESLSAHVALTRRELSAPWFLPTRTAARLLATGMRRGAAWPGPVLALVRGRDAEPVYRTVVVLEIAASSSASSSSASAA
jgi:SAM-dependent methyltransferase